MKINQTINNKNGMFTIFSVIIIILLGIIGISTTKWIISLQNNINISEYNMNMMSIAENKWNKLASEDFNTQSKRISYLSEDENGLKKETIKTAKYEINILYNKIGNKENNACNENESSNEDNNKCRKILIRVYSFDDNHNINKNIKPTVLYNTKFAENGNSVIPINSIIAYYGDIKDIPEKWKLCDGTNGTPDLRDRFLVGAGNLYNVGDIGGENKVTLNSKEQASHYHYYGCNNYNNQGNFARGIDIKLNDLNFPSTYLGQQDWNGHNGGGETDTSMQSGVNLVTSLAVRKDASEAHENRPPYFAVYYIMRIK